MIFHSVQFLTQSDIYKDIHSLRQSIDVLNSQVTVRCVIQFTSSYGTIAVACRWCSFFKSVEFPYQLDTLLVDESSNSLRR